MPASLLAHGGTAGLAAEVAVLILPILIFAALAWWSRRRKDEDRANASKTDQESS